MAVAIAIGAWGGRWLENNVTHWKPWTFYIGLFVGLGAAVNAVVRTARKFQRIIDHDERLQAEATQVTSKHTDRSSQAQAVENSPPPVAREEDGDTPQSLVRFNNPYDGDDDRSPP